MVQEKPQKKPYEITRDQIGREGSQWENGLRIVEPQA